MKNWTNVFYLSGVFYRKAKPTTIEAKHKGYLFYLLQQTDNRTKCFICCTYNRKVIETLKQLNENNTQVEMWLVGQLSYSRFQKTNYLLVNKINRMIEITNLPLIDDREKEEQENGETNNSNGTLDR